MTASERANLIRERLRKLFPAAVAPLPVAKRKPVERPIPGVMRTALYGVGVLEFTRRKKWVGKADPKTPTVPRPKRNTGVSALTKIAAQAPKKLKRHHATAEAYLRRF